MIIRADFPGGVVYGDDFPVPHPARLFGALVASHFDGCGVQEELDLLQQLESAAPPSLTIPNLHQRKVGTHFVRMNKKSRELKGRKYPATTVDGPIDYHFSTTVDVDVLSGLVSRVPYLGTSSSLCVLTVLGETESVEPNFFPGGRAEDKNAMRVPYPGYLEQLQRTHQRNMESLDRKGVRLHRPREKRLLYSSKRTLPAVTGEFSQLITVGLKGAGLAGTRGPAVSRAFRSSLMSVMQDPIPSVVSGHEEDGSCLKGSHIGFHPLLFSKAQHADGHLMGVGVLFPSGISHADRFKVLEGLQKLEKIKTRWGEYEVKQFDPSWSLLASRYTDVSTKWSTVTPIELPCFPRKNRPAHKIVSDCCEQSGYPKPEKVMVSSKSFLSGTYSGKEYEQKRGMLLHASIQWDRPVAGPISIGRGRYLGFGLCMADQ